MRIVSPRESGVGLESAAETGAAGLENVLEKHHADAQPAKKTGAAAIHQAAKESVSASIPFQMVMISADISDATRGTHIGAIGGVGGNPFGQNVVEDGCGGRGAWSAWMGVVPRLENRARSSKVSAGTLTDQLFFRSSYIPYAPALSTTPTMTSSVKPSLLESDAFAATRASAWMQSSRSLDACDVDD